MTREELAAVKRVREDAALREKLIVTVRSVDPVAFDELLKLMSVVGVGSVLRVWDKHGQAQSGAVTPLSEAAE